MVFQAQLTQSFGGSDEPSLGNTITTVQFDDTGKYMATGDRSGRIVVFKGDEAEEEIVEGGDEDHLTWAPYYQLQSHGRKIDQLNSKEIEPAISQLQFVPGARERVLVLSANETTIKLWRVAETPQYECCCSEMINESYRKENLQLPQITDDVEIFSSLQRSYSNAHEFHINQLSVNCHDESFISSDDLRVNLWRFDDHKQGLNIIDIKPDNMEALSEVITSACFHPKEGHTFAYSTTRGSVKVYDLRQSTICNNYRHYKCETQSSPAEEKEFSNELISSISDLKFSPDGKYMITRDYMTLKVWDVYMTGQPVEVIDLHNHLQPLLWDLYATENIFDKFTSSVSPCSTMALTGSYDNKFMIKGLDGSSIYNSSLPDANGYVKSWDDGQDLNIEERVVFSSWHPSRNVFAVAGMCSLHIYSY